MLELSWKRLFSLHMLRQNSKLRSRFSSRKIASIVQGRVAFQVNMNASNHGERIPILQLDWVLVYMLSWVSIYSGTGYNSCCFRCGRWPNILPHKTDEDTPHAPSLLASMVRAGPRHIFNTASGTSHIRIMITEMLYHCKTWDTHIRGITSTVTRVTACLLGWLHRCIFCTWLKTRNGFLPKGSKKNTLLSRTTACPLSSPQWWNRKLYSIGQLSHAMPNLVKKKQQPQYPDAMPNLVKKKQPQYPEQSRLRKLNVARHLHHIHVI